MDNFKTIYRILKAIDKSLDSDTVKIPTHEELGISLNRYYRILIILVDDDLIGGVSYKYFLGTDEPDIYITRPSLTLKGLEYLAENGTLQKAKDLVNGVVDIGTRLIP